MPTTTIRLEDELKARVAAAAARAGQSAHAFIVEAIAQVVARDEESEALHQVAEARWARVAETGRTVAWDDARAWLEAQASGQRARRPTPRVPKKR